MKKHSKIIIFVLLAILFFTPFLKTPDLDKGDAGNVVARSERSAKRLKRSRESVAERVKRAIENVNSAINFYGIIADEDGDPLSGVVLTYRIQQPRMMWDSNSVVKKITTDSQGVFQITGDRGSSLSFEKFDKDGYKKTEGQDLSYVYSDGPGQYLPEKDHPVIFTMISVLRVAPLVKEDATMQLKWDGIPVFYNIKTGKMGETGEIKITAKRGPVVGEGREALFDWVFKIEVPGGGVIETTKAEAFLAPESGYQAAWEFGYLSSDSDWAGGKSGYTYLFFRLENGNHGYLAMYFQAYPGRKVSGGISSYFNPSGGLILEE